MLLLDQLSLKGSYYMARGKTNGGDQAANKTEHLPTICQCCETSGLFLNSQNALAERQGVNETNENAAQMEWPAAGCCVGVWGQDMHCSLRVLGELWGGLPQSLAEMLLSVKQLSDPWEETGRRDWPYRLSLRAFKQGWRDPDSLHCSSQSLCAKWNSLNMRNWKESIPKCSTTWWLEEHSGPIRKQREQ